MVTEREFGHGSQPLYARDGLHKWRMEARGLVGTPRGGSARTDDTSGLSTRLGRVAESVWPTYEKSIDYLCVYSGQQTSRWYWSTGSVRMFSLRAAAILWSKK